MGGQYILNMGYMNIYEYIKVTYNGQAVTFSSIIQLPREPSLQTGTRKDC